MPDDLPAPALSFGTAAERYDRTRPRPPLAALDWMLTGRERTVLDLAAGTGQISRQLGDRDLRLVAVEPDPQMRALCVRHCPDVQVLDGTAEAIPLDGGSVDAVLVGSAWHWFDLGPAVAEIGRVLRPGGRLAAVGLTADPFVDWVGAMYGPAAERYRARVGRQYADVTVPSTDFADVETADLEFTLPLDVEAVRVLFTTFSHYLAASTQEKARLDATVLAVLAERAGATGTVDLPMRAWCWRTTRRPVRPGGSGRSGCRC